MYVLEVETSVPSTVHRYVNVEPVDQPLSVAAVATPTVGVAANATVPAAIVASWTTVVPDALTDVKPAFAAVTVSVSVLPESLGTGVYVAPVSVRPSMLHDRVVGSSPQPDRVGVTGWPTVAVGSETVPATSGMETVFEVKVAGSYPVAETTARTEIVWPASPSVTV